MAFISYKSPFHVTHDDEKANKMNLKMDLNMFIVKVIASKGWDQRQAAFELNISQSRILNIQNYKIEVISIDDYVHMLQSLGFPIDFNSSGALSC